jgi:hypothetical protein
MIVTGTLARSLVPSGFRGLVSAVGERADPYLASLVVLLLPDWRTEFELVDREVAGLDGIPAMRTRDGDRNANLTDGNDAGAVDDGNRDHLPALADTGLDLGELGNCHIRVGLVLETKHRSPAV